MMPVLVNKDTLQHITVWKAGTTSPIGMTKRRGKVEISGTAH